MHRLMEYRHEEIRDHLEKVGRAASMLHLDVLLLIYHFAKFGTGNILEIGPYIGGSTIAAAIPKFFSNCAFDPRSFPLPLANPGAPTVESKRNESSTGYEFVNLRLPRCGLHAGSEIIVDHKPTTVGQQITIAIQVPAHIVICIENEEAHFSAAQHLLNG